MDIIILGTNPLALILAKRLCQDGQDVTIVSSDQGKLQNIAEEIEVKTVLGRPSYPHVLRNAGAKSAKAILAVTENDELNMIACQVAHSIFKVPTKIARISSPHYVVRRELFGDEDLPIDVFINPDKIIARAIKHLLTLPHAMDAFDMCNGQLKAFSATVCAQSALLGKSIQEFNQLNIPGLVIHAVRDAVALEHDEPIREGDVTVNIAPSIYLSDFQSSLNPASQMPQSIMIAGATSSAEHLLKVLVDMSIKVIDSDREKCLNLVRNNDHITVINADFANSETLLNESIEGVDLFCALTTDDEDNLISAMQAKKLGAKRSLALIARHDYHDIIQKELVDILLSPHHLVTRSIYARLMHQPNIRHFHFTALNGSLMSIKIHQPDDLGRCDRHCCYVFRNHALYPLSDISLQAGDHVLYFNVDPATWTHWR